MTMAGAPARTPTAAGQATTFPTRAATLSLLLDYAAVGAFSRTTLGWRGATRRPV